MMSRSAFRFLARNIARPLRLLPGAAPALLVAGCVADTSPVDLRSIDRSPSPNDALACPAGMCRAAPDFESPAFAADGKALMESAAAAVRARPRTELVGRDAELDQLVFVERSRLFGFPDTIRIQGARAGGGATVIIYSRSNYGYWDLGVNRERVRDLLEELKRTAGPAGPPGRR